MPMTLPLERLPVKKATLFAFCFFAVGCTKGEAAPPAQPTAPPPAPMVAPATTTEPDQALSAGPEQPATPAADLSGVAAGFEEFFLHDECTGPFPPQPDTCAHKRVHEKSFTFGGEPGTVYDVTLRVRGIFEPTTVEGGETPYADHPYFKVGGKVTTLDWSYWHIDVSEPQQTYYLNHYPEVAHIIYKEDFEATIPVAGGAKVVISAIDGNDRQIDNGKDGPDRRQVIEGVVDQPLAGQMLRLDVVGVKAR